MELNGNLETIIEDIEIGRIRLTTEQKSKLLKGLKRPFYNDNWDKLKEEFRTEFEKYNYKRNNCEDIIVSLSLQYAVGILLKIKYKVDNVRKLPNYKQLKEDVYQILSIIKQPENEKL